MCLTRMIEAKIPPYTVLPPYTILHQLYETIFFSFNSLLKEFLAKKNPYTVVTHSYE